MASWERFDLELPNDFPVNALDAIHVQLSDPSEARRKSPEWAEWALACNGIVYRYLAADDHATELASSFDRGLSPPQPERYRQERLLFSFFAEGLSCLECLYYGFYFVGAMIDPTSFNAKVDPRDVTASFVTSAYERRFPSEQLSATLRAVFDDADTRAWRRVRNTLAHRGSPGRAFYEGGPQSCEAEWLAESLSGTLIRARRDWLGNTVERRLAPAVGFVQMHVV